MLANEVLITKKDKERLIKLAKEANAILEKYEYSLDYSQHAVTCMNRAKSLGEEFLQWCTYLYTNKEKGGENEDK